MLNSDEKKQGNTPIFDAINNKNLAHFQNPEFRDSDQAEDVLTLTSHISSATRNSYSPPFYKDKKYYMLTAVVSAFLSRIFTAIPWASSIFIVLSTAGLSGYSICKNYKTTQENQQIIDALQAEAEAKQNFQIELRDYFNNEMKKEKQTNHRQWKYNAWIQGIVDTIIILAEAYFLWTHEAIGNNETYVASWFFLGTGILIDLLSHIYTAHCLGAFRDKLSNLGENAAEISESLSRNASQKIRKYQTTIRNQNESIEILQDQTNQVILENKLLNQQLQTSANNLRSSNEKLSEAKGQLDQKKEENAELNTNLQDLQKKHQKLSSSLNTQMRLFEEYKGDREQADKKLNKTILKLRKENASLRTKLEDHPRQKQIS